MATVAPRPSFTIEEYIRLEDFANVRHEFLDGQVFAMAGGSPEHGAWAANVIGQLTSQLRGRPCRVQTSDVRVRVQATGLITYPDVSVVCGHAERDGQDRNAIVNPTLVVEVTSPGTVAYDRGEKLAHYQAIPALQEIVFVAHDARRVDVVRRTPEGSWVALTAGAGERATLASVGCTLDVDEVYFDPLEAPSSDAQAAG